MKNVVAIFFFTFIFSNSFAQWNWQNPSIPGKFGWADVKFITNQTGTERHYNIRVTILHRNKYWYRRKATMKVRKKFPAPPFK